MTTMHKTTMRKSKSGDTRPVTSCSVLPWLSKILCLAATCLIFPATATSLSFNYDKEGHLLGVTDNTTGKVVQSTFDSNGNLLAGTLVSPVTGSLSINAAPVNETATVSGQNDVLSFSVGAAQTLSLNVNYVSGTLAGATILVFNPDGTLLTDGSLTVQCTSNCAGSTTLQFTATQIGTYEVVVQQPQTSPGTGTMSFVVAQSSTSVPFLPPWATLSLGTLLVGFGLRKQYRTD